MITKQETQQVKGMAILAMLVLHLFCTLKPGDMFTPLVYVSGVPLSYFFGQAADFCVMAFCFVSGYGLYSAYQKSNLSAYVKGRQRSIAAFLSNYWLILLLYAGVALITGHAGEWLGSWKEFLDNVLLKSSYNGAWWFVLTYVLMVLLSPAVFYMVDRHPVVVAVLSPVVYTASYVVRFKIEPDWLPMQFALLGMSFAELLIGVYFCKYRIMDTLQSAWNHLSAKICGGGLWFLALLCAGTVIWRRYMPTLFVAPASGVIFVTVLLLSLRSQHRESRFFMLLGKHSTNIWLTHMFFYMPRWGKFVSVGKYSIVVLTILVGVSLLVSCALCWIQQAGLRCLGPASWKEK